MSTSSAADLPEPASGANRTRPQEGGGFLGRVAPNSALHWALLITGLVVSVAFNATYVIDGLLRPGYDSVKQPMSALSLGPGGWVQTANFIVFGLVGCATAFAWRPTLTPGLGAVWYPRLRILSGLALICAGVFPQDPGGGYPAAALAPATPSVHAVVHNLVSYVSLTTIVAELIILGRRFAREPRWRAWSPAALAAAALMMGLLAAFGALVAHDGPAGVFEKLASATPTLLGVAVTGRLLAEREATIAAPGRADARTPRSGALPGTTAGAHTSGEGGM
jgi:hypothetical protein